MEIKINLTSDALNKFNEEKISESLDNYIMNELKHKPIKNDLTLALSGENKEKIGKIIHDYYKNKFYYAQKIDAIDNYVRGLLFIVGIIAILLSEQLKNLASEIFLIAGWVIIWEILYDILFNELRRKRKTKIYKALANCKIND